MVSSLSISISIGHPCSSLNTVTRMERASRKDWGIGGLIEGSGGWKEVGLAIVRFRTEGLGGGRRWRVGWFLGGEEGIFVGWRNA